MMSPRGRNAIGRRRAISAPSRSEEAAINPHANASATGTPQARSGQAGHRGRAAPFTLEQAGQPIHHEHNAIAGNSAPLSEAYSPNLREGRRPRKSSLSGGYQRLTSVQRFRNTPLIRWSPTKQRTATLLARRSSTDERRCVRTPSDVHSRGPVGVQLSDQLILAGVLQAILYLFFVRAIDLYEREPLPYVVAVFLWGFAVATTIAVFFNTLAKTTFASLVSEREANALTAIFVAPVVEESAKGLA